VSRSQNLPVTNPLRTMVDLAGVGSPAVLAGVVDAALASKLVTVPGLLAEVQRLSRPGRPGLGALRRQLGDRGFVGAPAPSVLESKMQRIVRSVHQPGMSTARVEVRAGPDGEYRLDIAWSPILFAVEVDGYAWHATPEQKERDEARRNKLQQAGWTILVYSWRRVVNEPGRLRREIAASYRECERAAAAGRPGIRGGPGGDRT
jgi:very-short-patch-repair endonuclease